MLYGLAQLLGGALAGGILRGSLGHARTLEYTLFPPRWRSSIDQDFVGIMEAAASAPQAQFLAVKLS